MDTPRPQKITYRGMVEEKREEIPITKMWPNKSKHPTANRTRDAEVTHETPFYMFNCGPGCGCSLRSVIIMKTIGLSLLLVGFSWVIYDAVSSFTSYQHMRWILQSKNLPAGESIPRDEAVSAMRELSLTLKNRHRLIIVPSSLMLAGGLLIYLRNSPDRSKQTEQVDASDR